AVWQLHLLLERLAAKRHGRAILPGRNHCGRRNMPARICAERPMALPRDCRNRVGVNGARALRFALALAALAATALLADSALATGNAVKSLPTLNQQVVAAVNKFRVAHGLVPLRESAALDRSARQHSAEMGRRGYFGHSSADGTVFWRRIRHYYTANHYRYWAVGENLVWRGPSLSVGQAMSLWLARAPHRANLMRSSWREMGVS